MLAGSAHGFGGCALLMAASSGLLEHRGEEGMTPGPRVASVIYRERGKRRRHEALRLAAVICGVACGGFDG